jgi:hypothetical protein
MHNHIYPHCFKVIWRLCVHSWREWMLHYGCTRCSSHLHIWHGGFCLLLTISTLA